MEGIRVSRRLAPFFERQQSARRRERVFLFKFSLVVALCLLVVAGLLTWVTTPFHARVGSHLGDGALRYALILLICTGGTVVFALAATWLRRRHLLQAATSLKSGSDLRDIGNSRDPRWQRAEHVMQEMCIAAGMPMPEFCVMTGHTRINGIALGHSSADALVMISEGAIRSLNRDEMQGLCAYSLGQIANGDMAFNMRISSYLYVLQVGPLLARELIHPGGWQHLGVRHLFGWLFFGLWLGLALGALTLPGYLGARALQFLIERERQGHADACALQFTRNPCALRTLLMKASVLGEDSPDQPREFEQLAHCFFISPRMLVGRSTLEPVVWRLRELGLPNLTVPALIFKHREYRDAWERESLAAAELAREEMVKAAQSTEARSFIESVVTATMLAGSAAAPGGIEPATPRQAVTSSNDPRVLLLSMLIDRNVAIERAQFHVLRQHYREDEISCFMAALESSRNLSSRERSLRLDAQLPRLRHLPAIELGRLRSTVRDLEAADAQLDVFEFALGRNLLVVVDDLLKPGRAHGTLGLADVEVEIGVLLSTMAAYSASEHATPAFEVGRKFLGIGIGARPPVNTRAPPLRELGLALGKLDRLQPIAKELLIEALEAVVDFDRSRSLAERELFRVIGAALHVPVPRDADVVQTAAQPRMS